MRCQQQALPGAEAVRCTPPEGTSLQLWRVTLDIAVQPPGVIPAFGHLPARSRRARGPRERVSGTRGTRSCRDRAQNLFSRPPITFPNTGTSGLPLRSKHSFQPHPFLPRGRRARGSSMYSVFPTEGRGTGTGPRKIARIEPPALSLPS